MAGLVTKENNRSVDAYIENIENKSKREDGRKLLELMRKATGNEARMWGNEKVPDFIVGFGKYEYRRKGGKETFEWFNTGFAVRSSKLTVYLTFDINQEKALLDKLGKASWGKGCLYINKLKDVDLDVLSELVKKSKDARWH